MEDESPVTTKTYCRFFFFAKKNYIFVPLTFLIFLISEIILAILFRMVAMYDDVSAGTNVFFGGNWGMYEGVLILLVGSALVALIIKYFLLNLVILFSSEKIHERMVDAVIHSPT